MNYIYAYSNYKDNVEIDHLLNRIETADFKRYLQEALFDKNSSLNSYKDDEIYKEGLISYFNQLKSFYAETVKEGQSTIYIHG